MTTFQMNGKTYKVVEDTPMPGRVDACSDCAFRVADGCAYVDQYVSRPCYLFPQQHYEEVPAQSA
jgi:hypothetical protein